MLLMLLIAGCAEGTPANMRTMSSPELETLVGSCAPCSDECVKSYADRCTEGDVDSKPGTVGECLVSCVGPRASRESYRATEALVK
jgi:hypothetical protein